MTMQIVNLVQGSPEWHVHRAQHFNASDAPAMMGASPYRTRSELIKELATGIVPEVDAVTQRRFDDGHQFEALARPLAEEIIGEELSPCVGTRGKYSASFDGLTFMNDVAFEHKTLNSTLREVLVPGCTGADLPLQYRVQMEQQAMVSGCERILFMASKWTAEGLPVEEYHCWYEPDAELRAQIIAGWEQIEKDVAAYDASAPQPAPAVAEPVESLPAVAVQLQGSLAVVSNLDKFGDALRGFISRMVSKPSTDQEFADADAECKALKKAEDMLEAAESSALAQVSDVELLRRTVADLKNLARTTRLAREKLVAAEKDARRTALVTDAQKELDGHVTALNQRLGANWLPRIAGGFAETIKGKKSLTNMQDAVAVALTSAKHEANQLASRLETNRKHLVQEGTDWIALFADFATVGTKAPEDFQALAALRIGQHKQAEAQRLEAERARIRAEEEAKAKREAEAKVKAELEQQRQQVQQQVQAAQADIAQAQQDGTLAKPLADDLSSLVADQAAEGVAGIDAQQAISTAKASAAVAPAAVPAEDEPVLTLGQINTRMEALGLGKISAATLEFHGIPFAKERAAVQIKATQARRLMLLISMGARKLADEVPATTV
ncbi:YqaJ viral recombinase family protein [Comamonas terrae]|uniref:YqaJ viral recombinase family protein n=1 Tax=Comamonas terrae TaxID=673548 RepID=A0ABW5UU27_9BURK|nr:YqaJ viral recombinase family protein [Comamonas terrae]